LDQLVLFTVNWALVFVAILTGLMTFAQLSDGSASLAGTLLVSVPFLLYYALLEGIGGCSLGKWALRLRVRGREGAETPGLARAFYDPPVCLRRSVPTWSTDRWAARRKSSYSWPRTGPLSAGCGCGGGRVSGRRCRKSAASWAEPRACAGWPAVRKATRSGTL